MQGDQGVDGALVAHVDPVCLRPLIPPDEHCPHSGRCSLSQNTHGACSKVTNNQLSLTLLA